MPKGIPNPKEEAGLEKRLVKTRMNHVYNLDITGDGRFKEVAVVKLQRSPKGDLQSIHYIDTGLLDNVDRGRLKAIVTSVHADKYELWDLLSQNRLNNGKNALDYFHQLTKVVHGPGSVTTTMNNSIMGARNEASEMIGSEFSDPESASLDTQAAE